MAIKDTNYITIQGWMINQLKLKGNDLIVYAIIYGFSQDGENRFTGSLQYLADATLSTKQGVMKNLKSLCEKGFLGKEERIINRVRFVEYYATKFNGVCNKDEQGMQQSLMGGIQQSLPNNTSLYNTNNNLDIKESSEEETPPPAPKENKKIKHGEYGHVTLTEDELKKLNEQYGNAQELIECLDEYIELSGKKYKSHYLAIKKWVVDAVKEKKAGNGTKPTSKQNNKVAENKPIDPLEARLQARLQEKLENKDAATSESINQKLAAFGISRKE